jgi:uncharacterized protein YkwD
LQSITTLRALARAVPSTLRPHLRRHRAITRVAVAFVSLAVAMAFSLEGATAGPTQPLTRPTTSILPENVGIGLPATAAVTFEFAEPMDRSSVEASLSLRPGTSVRTVWRADGRALQLLPTGRWQTDTRYVVTVAADTRRADGRELGDAKQVSFTTQTAPVVADFALHYVGEPDAQVMRVLERADASAASAAQPSATDTASLVSTGTTITIGFSVAMDRQDVERHLVLSPSVPGIVTWNGNSLIFEPSARLKPDARYALTVAGAHDLLGNPLGGDSSFSFTTRVGAQVVKTSPKDTARDVVPKTVSLWFSQPMDTGLTGSALKVSDKTTGKPVPGKVSWNEAGTQLTFTPTPGLSKGHTIVASLAKGAVDTDGNAVAGSWSFRTKPAAAPVVRRTTTVASGPAAPADQIAYALWQINQSRAAYGFAPLRLDSAISAVASAHAWDMINYGYFSHTGRDGSTVSTRLRAAGISFSWSGENMCYVSGQSLRATLQWCHSTFMSEPYPGYANHIGNILSSHYTRVGIAIAQSGPKIIIVWDFAG